MAPAAKTLALDSYCRRRCRLCPADINECAQNPNLCANGACENLMGSHRCICNPGYQVDATGKVCTDINECELDDMVCNGGQCRNTPGSFQVRPLGPSAASVSPVPPWCHSAQYSLTDSPRHHQCICDSGTRFNVSTQTCEDVDECRELGAEACAGGECTNTRGSYECTCPPGSMLDNTGRVCIGETLVESYTIYSKKKYTVLAAV